MVETGVDLVFVGRVELVHVVGLLNDVIHWDVEDLVTIIPTEIHVDLLTLGLLRSTPSLFFISIHFTEPYRVNCVSDFFEIGSLHIFKKGVLFDFLNLISFSLRQNLFLVFLCSLDSFKFRVDNVCLVTFGFRTLDPSELEGEQRTTWV